MPCQVPYPLSCHVCPFVATLLQASGRLGTTPEGGQKTLPIAHVFFKDLKHMLHILSYIIIYIYIICSDPGNQGYFGKNDKSSIEWPRSSNESSKATKNISCWLHRTCLCSVTVSSMLLWPHTLRVMSTDPSLFLSYFYLPSIPTYCALSIWFSDSICSFCLAVSPVKR